MKSKRAIKLLFITGSIIILSACSFEELPPKTDNDSSTYVLPKGEVPTADELNTVNNIRSEYDESISK